MKREGFTLVELIVIMTIFTIMASVALFNFQGFKSQVAVNNLSHDVGLLLREAQTFGWATLSEDGGGQIQLDEDTNDPLRFAHGVFFRSNGSAYSDDLLLYKKGSSNPGNEYYDENSADEEMDRISITGPYHIVAITGSNNREDLKLDGDQIPAGLDPFGSNISVAFSRPHPEAFIFEDASRSSYNYIGIYIGERGQYQTAEKVIIVSSSGEVIVQ